MYMYACMALVVCNYQSIIMRPAISLSQASGRLATGPAVTSLLQAHDRPATSLPWACGRLATGLWQACH